MRQQMYKIYVPWAQGLYVFSESTYYNKENTETAFLKTPSVKTPFLENKPEFLVTYFIRNNKNIQIIDTKDIKYWSLFMLVYYII